MGPGCALLGAGRCKFPTWSSSPWPEAGCVPFLAGALTHCLPVRAVGEPVTLRQLLLLLTQTQRAIKIVYLYLYQPFPITAQHGLQSMFRGRAEAAPALPPSLGDQAGAGLPTPLCGLDETCGLPECVRPEACFPLCLLEPSPCLAAFVRSLKPVTHCMPH